MAKVQVKRVGVFSLAKIYAVTMAAFGVIIGVIYGLIFMAVGGAMMAGGRDTGAAGASSLVIGLVMMVAVPIFYGVLGFLFGLLGGAVYNVAARTVGGVEMELENVDEGYSPPPPPQWAPQPPPPGQPGQQYPY
jgi:hypothetical protein